MSRLFVVIPVSGYQEDMDIVLCSGGWWVQRPESGPILPGNRHMEMALVVRSLSLVRHELNYCVCIGQTHKL